MSSQPDYSYYPIQKLSFEHNVEQFDSGIEELNQFLKKYALHNQKAESSQTNVACQDKTVLAFYTLTVGSVHHKDAPDRIRKGLPKYPIPVMVLARLAIDKNYQRKGLGKALLKNALQRTAQAADIAGIRSLMVHAKNEEANAFYKYFNFDVSPVHPNWMFLIMKEIKRLVSMTN